MGLLAKLFKKIEKASQISTKTNISQSQFCPYCNNKLTKLPLRKTKCIYCNNNIYVRSKQTLFQSTLLTKNDARTVDWIKRMNDFGVTQKDYSDMDTSLSHQFGKKALSTDIIWGLFNKLLLVNTKDIQTLHMIYYQMALFLNEEGKNPFEMLQLASKMDLLSLKKDYVKKVSILTAGSQSCESCNKLNEKIISINQALKELPIPCKECTFNFNEQGFGFCRCCYVAEFD